MRKFFTFVLIFSSLISVLSTCKKDKSYRSEGYIKGTIVGKNKDAFKYDETFTFDKFYSESEATYTLGDGYKQFAIYRIDPDFGQATLSFTLMNSGTIVDGTLSLIYTKTTDLYVSRYEINCFNSAEESQYVTFSSINFDETTHLLTGNYAANITQYNTSNVAYTSTIKGSFKVTVKQENN